MIMADEKNKLYTIDALQGMDLRHTADKSHASYMENLLCIDGALKKRNGVFDLFSVCDENGNPLPINGIYDYLGTKIIHAGGYLFDCGINPLSERERTHKPQKINSELLLESKPLDGFVHNGKLWLASGGELVCYDGVSLASLGEGAYIPTTREGIKSIVSGSGYKNAEAENVLTDRRRNKIRGTKAPKSSYELDCFANEEKGFTLICQMDISLNDNDSQAHFIGHTYPQRIMGNDVSRVLGGATLAEVSKMLDGTGTTHGFDAISETNIFFNEPIYVTSLVLTAQYGSSVPRIKLSYGASTVYEASELTGKGTLDLSVEANGQMIDSITLYGNDSTARISTIDLRARKTYEGEVELIFNESKAEMGKAYYPKRIITPQGQELMLYASADGSKTKGAFITFSKGLNTTALNMYFDAPCYNEGRDNIQITFSKANVEIPKISLAKECKTDTGRQILALCFNNTDLGFTSDTVGFTYAPRSLYTTLGGGDKITALCQMENYGVGVYKSDKSFFATITEQGIKYKGSVQSNGCVNNRCACTIGSDTLTLSQNGVFGSQKESGATSVPRSSAINSMLTEQCLDGAFCLEYEGRLYLFLDEKCLVCDTRYRAESQLENDFEYEWFLLTGLGARCASVLDGKMYLGTENGKIRTLGEGFCDVSFKNLHSGEYLFTQNGTSTDLYLSGELGSQDGGEISIENAGIVLAKSFEQLDAEYGAGFALSYDEMLYKDGTTRLFTGMEIFAIADGEIYLGEILEIDEQSAIAYTSLPCEVTYETLFKDSKNAKITLKRSSDGYKMYENESELSLIDYDSASVLLICKEPVVARYESARLSPEGVERPKNLHRIILDLLPCTSGNITLGYTTNKGTENGKRVLGKGLDFAQLDLGALSLGASLQKSCALRCFERGMSSIIIKITSSAPSDFALNGISLVYNVILLR